MWYRTPGRSRTRPPRTRTIECSCRLCPSPPMYAVISFPFDSRARAILRSAELGCLGVVVRTTRHTPRFCGHASRSRTFDFVAGERRGLRMSWLIVGMGTAGSVRTGGDGVLFGTRTEGREV